MYLKTKEAKRKIMQSVLEPEEVQELSKFYGDQTPWLGSNSVFFNDRDSFVGKSLELARINQDGDMGGGKYMAPLNDSEN